MSSSSFDSVGGIVAPLHVRLDKERSVGKSYTQSVPLHIGTVVSYARSGTSYWYASALRDLSSHAEGIHTGSRAILKCHFLKRRKRH